MKRAILSFLTVGFICGAAFAQDVGVLRTEIHSKLRDKRCNMPLSECNCPEAKEMKGYIDALLETGTPKEEIYYKTAKKFSLKTILDEDVKKEVEKRLAAEAGENRPQIVLEPASFNFGEVKKSQGKVSAIFKLRNKGNADLVITNLRASCVCTTISLTVDKQKSPYFDNKGAPKGWKMELKPNQAGELEVVLDLAHKAINAGDLTREVDIISNDPLYPEASVRVEAKVIAVENPAFSGKLENGVRVVELKASQYKFAPDPIVVKKGELVRLVAKSLDVGHGISIPEFNLNLSIPAGTDSVGEFTAAKEGEFTTYCSVYCGSGHGKMQGKLIVK